MEFKLRKVGGEVETCDCCNFPVPTGEYDWPCGYNGYRHSPKKLLCEFCSTSMASRHTEYQATDEYTALRQEVWKAAASVYNMLKFGDTL